MRKRKPHIALLQEVTIGREGEHGVIAYLDDSISVTYLHIGPQLEGMTDEEILMVHNDILRAQERLRTEHPHIAVEIPEGSPQIEYSAACDQWVPRGEVLRCVISDGGPDFEAMVRVDDRELSMSEFGRLLLTYNGWGMRIVFVPEEEIGIMPTIEVREPDIDE